MENFKENGEKWQIGEVRTAVVKENKRGDDPVTYAPDGRIVVLKNETERDLAPGDLIEVYIVEEKSRNYYGQVMEIVKKYAEIKKLTRKKGKAFQKQYENLLEKAEYPESTDKKIEDIKTDLDQRLDEVNESIEGLAEKIDDLSIQPPVEHSDGEDGEEGKMELPLEARASISEKENSYVLYIQENDTRDFLAEMDDELKFDIYTGGDRNSQPLVIKKKPWKDGRVSVPVVIKDNLTHAYENGGEVPVTIKRGR